jgi:hypothetical protein
MLGVRTGGMRQILIRLTLLVLAVLSAKSHGRQSIAEWQAAGHSGDPRSPSVFLAHSWLTVAALLVVVAVWRRWPRAWIPVAMWRASTAAFIALLPALLSLDLETRGPLYLAAAGVLVLSGLASWAAAWAVVITPHPTSS